MKLTHRARAVAVPAAAPTAVPAEAGQCTVRANIGAGFEAYLLAAGSPATANVASRLSGTAAEISTVTESAAKRARPAFAPIGAGSR